MPSRNLNFLDEVFFLEDLPEFNGKDRLTQEDITLLITAIHENYGLDSVKFPKLYLTFREN